MKGILINGSPKKSGSASGILLSDLKSLLGSDTQASSMSVDAAHPAARYRRFDERWEPSQQERGQFLGCQFLVLLFPLYVDGIPSHLLNFLSELEWQAKTGRLFKGTELPAVYAVVNCGFYEGKQTRHALRMIENWCARCGFEWKQGIGCGAGGMLCPIDKTPIQKWVKKPLYASLKDMAGNIDRLKRGKTQLISLHIPRWLYIAATQSSWKKSGRDNGLRL